MVTPNGKIGATVANAANGIVCPTAANEPGVFGSYTKYIGNHLNSDFVLFICNREKYRNHKSEQTNKNIRLKIWMHLWSPALHPFALNRTNVSDFLRQFCQVNRVVILVWPTVYRVRAATGLVVCALVKRACVVQLQQPPLPYASGDDVLGPEFHDLVDELRVLHARAENT